MNSNMLEQIVSQSDAGRKYVKVEWMKEEDAFLETLMMSLIHRKANWSEISRLLNTQFHKNQVRFGRQCQKRWQQVIQPMKLLPWSKKEEEELLQLYQKYTYISNKIFQDCQVLLPRFNKLQISTKLRDLLEIAEKTKYEQVKDQKKQDAKMEDLFQQQKIKREAEIKEEQLKKKRKKNNLSVLCHSLSSL